MGSASAGPGLATTVSSGDRRRSLQAIRDKLADELTAADGNTAAQIATVLVKVIAEIEALPTGEVSKVDELRARRAARESAARQDAAGS